MDFPSRAFFLPWKILLLGASLLIPGAPALAADSAPAPTPAPTIHREGWSFDRSQFSWYHPDKIDDQKKHGTLRDVEGWAEYDFDVPADDWYALWENGTPSGWPRDVFLDGKVLFWLTATAGEDTVPNLDRFKEGNLYLTKGRHTIRFRRLSFPGALPASWELWAAQGDPAGSIRVTDSGTNVVRVNTKTQIKITGGTTAATSYELVVRNDETKELTPVGTVTFPAASHPSEKAVEITFPKQGVYTLLARVNGNLLHAPDLKADPFVAIDTQNPSTPPAQLQTTNVVDIDCTTDRTLGVDYWEKDGPTRIVDSPLGRYRESTGRGSSNWWSTAGFSYKFDLPDDDHIYRLQVDYPDDDRRSMGLWINDGATESTTGRGGGLVCTGGVETGDHYPLTHKMQTYEAYFYPLKNKDCVIAVINLVPGLKSAAAHIRIDRIDSGLPAAPLGQTHGRSLGFYFEEAGRWIKFFGGDDEAIPSDIKTLERWAQWNRYLGANLMFPTINAYQSNLYSSRVLDGYHGTTINKVRIGALMAEKYGSQYVPEFDLSGQVWFDKGVMGVWTEKTTENGRETEEVKFASPEAEGCIIRDYNGSFSNGNNEPFLYNPLNPRVQDMYISILGELADTLGDTKSFAGISSRVLIGWMWQGWNVIPGLEWGYDDWTVQQYEKETGVKVPGVDGDPARFHQRFDFLTSASQIEPWQNWRCQKIFAYHKRLRDRIQKAKPSAKFFLTYWDMNKPQAPTLGTVNHLRELGVDLRLYEKEPGIVLVPWACYGRRYSTPLADANILEPVFDEGTKAIARSGDRGFGCFSSYYEINGDLDWSKYGGKPYAAFDACIPSTVNEREMYALSLADSDTSFFLNGGNGWIFGTPSLMQPFLREYRALPAVKFEPFAKGRDPVAVWQHKDKDGTLWFYAVNRLPVPVKVTLQLSGDSKKVVPAAGGDAITLDGDNLTFSLDAFMLKSFHSTGAALADCQVETPADFVAKLKTEIDDGRQLRDDLAARHIVPELTAVNQQAALDSLDDAIKGFDQGHYGVARARMGQVALMRVYYASGRYPTGVLDRSVPPGVPQPAQPPIDKAEIIGDGRGDLDSIDDLAYDSEGRLWVSSARQVLQLDAKGAYSRTVPLYWPYIFNDGDSRGEPFTRADLGAAQTLKTLPGDQIAVQQTGASPFTYNGQGYATRQATGYGFTIFEHPVDLLAADSKGNLYGNCTVEGHLGVYEFDLTGALIRKLTDYVASGGAVDANGCVYLSSPKGLFVLDADGQPLGSIDKRTITKLVVTPDGTRIFGVADQSVYCYTHDGKGLLARAWSQDFPEQIRAISLSPAGTIALAFNEPADHVVARQYKVLPTGLDPAQDLVHDTTTSSTPAVLSGGTPLKVHDGCLYFIANNKLMKLTPGTPDKIEVAFDPQFSNHPEGWQSFEAFDFAPNGDLYLVSHWNGSARGVNVYRCDTADTGWAAPKYLNNETPISAGPYSVDTNVTIDPGGKLILRLFNPDHQNPDANAAFFSWSPDSPPQKLIDMGLVENNQNPGGMSAYLAGDGGLLFTAGEGEAIASLSPQGQVLWQDKRFITCPPGYFDLREPCGITADSQGRIWVTDTVRHQILNLNAQGEILHAYGHFGTADDRDGLSFNGPTGIATLKDSAGVEWLYIADTYNLRLVKWRLH